MINKIVDNIENFIVIVTSIIMLTLTFANVVSRYWLHASLAFTDEVVTSLFVIASLAGSSIAIRKNAHVGLDFVTSFMPEKTQKLCVMLGCLLGLIFCVILFKLGLDMVIQEYTSKQLSATMQWPEWIYGSTIPVGAALLSVRYLLTLILNIKNFNKKGVEE